MAGFQLGDVGFVDVVTSMIRWVLPVGLLCCWSPMQEVQQAGQGLGKPPAAPDFVGRVCHAQPYSRQHL